MSAVLVAFVVVVISPATGCAHEQSRPHDVRVHAPADGTLERLLTLDIMLFALAPAVADRPNIYKRHQRLRARLDEIRANLRSSIDVKDALDNLEVEVRELVNRLDAQGIVVDAIRATHGVLAIVHSGEEAGVDLTHTRYEIDGWSTFGEGSRVELRRLLPAGQHNVRITGEHEQQVFAVALLVSVDAQRQTLVLCSTAVVGMSLDISCTVDGRSANSSTAPVVHNTAAMAHDLEPTAIGEPIALDEPMAHSSDTQLSPEARLDAADRGPSVGSDSGMIVAQARADIAVLRERMARAALSTEVRLELAASLVSLDEELARIESRMRDDPDASGELVADGSFARLVTRLETLKIIGKLIENLHPE